LAPIDFSENSKMALEQAIEVCGHYKNAKIQCLNVYSIPQGYHYSGKSMEEYESIMQIHAQKDFEKFLSILDHHDIPLEFEHVNSEDENIAGAIYNYAKDRNCTGICIGSKGRTPAASLILGSVAENPIIQNKHLPIFVVKERNQNMDIFSAIKKGSY
jgi:nucleotide-binding universal stress UspA family protein